MTAEVDDEEVAVVEACLDKSKVEDSDDDDFNDEFCFSTFEVKQEIRHHIGAAEFALSVHQKRNQLFIITNSFHK